LHERTHLEAARQSQRSRRTIWLVAIFVLCLPLAAQFLYQHCTWPLIDSHPRRLGSWGTMHFQGKTEADFEAVFGCPGRLVGGSRTAGTGSTIEWSDDTMCVLVSFGADGRWVRIQTAPFFGAGPSHIHTPFEWFLLSLRRMGLNVR
jgi:hypothetical protein